MSSPNLTEHLEQQLRGHNLDLNDWRSLIQRLLDYGVLCRADSQVEAEFYDHFVRIQPLVDDYLHLMGVRLQHDTHFQFVRLIPPGARLPGLDDESDEPFNGGFRQRLNQHEIALILVLRAEYDKALREGLIEEQGCTALSLESVTLAMKNLLRRTLPDNLGERRQVFKRLRQLRLIHYVQDVDLDQNESWIKVRPLVINLVSNEWLEKIRTDLAAHAEFMNADAGIEEVLTAELKSAVPIVSIERTNEKVTQKTTEAVAEKIVEPAKSIFAEPPKPKPKPKPKSEPKTEPKSKASVAKSVSAKSASPKASAVKATSAKTTPAKAASPKTTPAKTAPKKAAVTKIAPGKVAPGKAARTKAATVKPSAVKVGGSNDVKTTATKATKAKATKATSAKTKKSLFTD